MELTVGIKLPNLAGLLGSSTVPVIVSSRTGGVDSGRAMPVTTRGDAEHARPRVGRGEAGCAPPSARGVGPSLT
eukprot:8174336-Heterocapsa_arctica.AAC.1